MHCRFIKTFDLNKSASKTSENLRWRSQISGKKKPSIMIDRLETPEKRCVNDGTKNTFLVLDPLSVLSASSSNIFFNSPWGVWSRTGSRRIPPESNAHWRWSPRRLAGGCLWGRPGAYRRRRLRSEDWIAVNAYRRNHFLTMFGTRLRQGVTRHGRGAGIGGTGAMSVWVLGMCSLRLARRGGGALPGSPLHMVWVSSCFNLGDVLRIPPNKENQYDAAKKAVLFHYVLGGINWNESAFAIERDDKNGAYMKVGCSANF